MGSDCPGVPKAQSVVPSGGHSKPVTEVEQAEGIGLQSPDRWRSRHLCGAECLREPFQSGTGVSPMTKLLTTFVCPSELARLNIVLVRLVSAA